MNHVASLESPGSARPCRLPFRVDVSFPEPLRSGFQRLDSSSCLLPTGRSLSQFGTVFHESDQQAVTRSRRTRPRLSWLNFSRPGFRQGPRVISPVGALRSAQAPHAGSRCMGAFASPTPRVDLVARLFVHVAPLGVRLDGRTRTVLSSWLERRQHGAKRLRYRTDFLVHGSEHHSSETFSVVLLPWQGQTIG